MSTQKTPGIVVFLVTVGWVLILFFGFIFGVKKSFRPPQKSDKQSASELLREQRQKNEDVMEQQKRLMEDRRRRMQDMQRR